MPKMDDNELGSVIRSEIQQAQNYFETEFADARMKAIDYYLGEPLGNERDGFSSVVSHDFADVVETLMPSLMRIFTSSDKFVIALLIDVIGQFNPEIERTIDGLSGLSYCLKQFIILASCVLALDSDLAN